MVTTIKGVWVKKTVTGKDFDEFYKRLDAYTLMGKEGEGRAQKHIVAFLTTEDNLREALNQGKDIQRIVNREELVKIQNHRKANSIYPRPFPGRDEVLEEILESPEPEPQQQNLLEDTPEEIADQEKTRKMFQSMREANEPIFLEDIPF